MSLRDVLVIAGALLAYAIVSRRLERWWITMPIVFVAAGALLGGTDVVDLAVAIDEVAIVAEVTLAVILFGDAVRMNAARLRRSAMLPLRLLLIGLPVTIAMGTLVNWWLLPGVSLAAGGLIASVLAPTDAALGEAIVSDPAVPVRIRDALNVEAGLNDGLAVPAVLLFIDLIRDDLDSGAEWSGFLLRQIGGGVTIGVLGGGGAAWLLRRAMAREWVDPFFAQLATLATAIVTFAAAGELGVNQFVAAFVAGLAFGSVFPDDEAEHLDEYTTDSGLLLATISFFVFGNLFVVEALGSLTWPVAVCAVAALTVGRILPVAIATLGAGLRPPTVLFLGWFGPRGLASIVFGILLLEEDLEVGGELFDVIALVVVLSVVLHGISSVPGAAAYGRWYAPMAATEPDMPESVDVAMRRLRR